MGLNQGRLLLSEARVNAASAAPIDYIEEKILVVGFWSFSVNKSFKLITSRLQTDF